MRATGRAGLTSRRVCGIIDRTSPRLSLRSGSGRLSLAGGGLSPGQCALGNATGPAVFLPPRPLGVASRIRPMTETTTTTTTAQADFVAAATAGVPWFAGLTAEQQAAVCADFVASD